MGFQKDWKTADRANQWVRYVNTQYPNDIVRSVQETRVYTGPLKSVPKMHRSTHIELRALDTVQALYDLQRPYQGRVCALNFASYKNPGGKFLDGSKAQEEALCHASTLYPILAQCQDYYNYNKRNLNFGLYTDRALYTPDVVFFYEGQNFKADVITCAAPNLLAFDRFMTDVKMMEKNIKALEQRCKFVLDVAESEGVDTLILGAWGCGVFRQNPDIVSEFFYKYIPACTIPRIIFAVLDKKGKHYAAFERAFLQHGELL